MARLLSDRSLGGHRFSTRLVIIEVIDDVNWVIADTVSSNCDRLACCWLMSTPDTESCRLDRLVATVWSVCTLAFAVAAWVRSPARMFSDALVSVAVPPDATFWLDRL